MRRLSSSEYQEWLQFYLLDPWGEQRADMRMARLGGLVAQPHLKQGVTLDTSDFLLFPDDANDLPDDMTPQEKKWARKLKAGED